MSLKIVMATVAILATWFAPGSWAGDAAKLADSALIAQGNKQWEAGRPEDARKSFEQAIVINPRSIDAQMKLGGLQLSSLNYAAAIQTYQRTISLDGNNAKAWMGLGLAYLHTGQGELSRAAFGEAIRVDPSRSESLAKLMEKPAE